MNIQAIRPVFTSALKFGNTHPKKEDLECVAQADYDDHHRHYYMVDDPATVYIDTNHPDRAMVLREAPEKFKMEGVKINFVLLKP